MDESWAEDAEDGAFGVLLRALAKTPKIAPRLEPGARVAGRFEIEKRLGAGGMGVVYRAKDLRLGRSIALKLHNIDAGTAAHERSTSEAAAMARLQHPNVVTVHEVGNVGENQLYIAMEFVDGVTLGDWLREHPRTGPQIIDRFIQAGRGLAAAHAAGLVHRDVKPDNLLIGHDGRVRVADFGLAGDEDAMMSEGGTFLGTPAYASPEQFEGATIDARSDQFSLCAALFEALYGERPFKGKTPAALALAVSKTQPRLVTKAAPGTPPGLRRILVRGLSADPKLRYRDLDALIDDLDNALGSKRRKRNLALVAFGLLGALLAGMAIMAPSDPCASTPDLGDLWDGARKSALLASFEKASTEASRADGPRVASRLDEYASAWAEATEAACRATWVDTAQSPQMLERRGACLEDCRLAVAAFLDVLTDADAETTARALRNAIDLPPIAACADPAYLAAMVPPPDSPAVEKRVREVRMTLANLEAAKDAGRFRMAYTGAKAARDDAMRLDYLPVQAEAWFVIGDAERLLGRYDEARVSTERAYFLAREAGSDALSARVATALVYLLSFHLVKDDDALAWGRHARADVERLGGAGSLRGHLLMNVGTALEQKGRVVEAVRTASAAVAELTRALGDNHADVARARTRLGSALEAKGDRKQAVVVLEVALRHAEKIFGPKHRELHRPLAELGQALSPLGQNERAIAVQERALRICRASFGVRHVNTGFAELNLGVAHHYAGDLAKAGQHYRRAANIVAEALGPDHRDTALCLTNLALTMPKEPKKAAELHRQVIGIFEKQGKMHADVARARINLAKVLVDAGDARGALAEATIAARIWDRVTPDGPNVAFALQLMGRAELDLGRPSRAVTPLERAVAIREREEFNPRYLAESRFSLARALGRTSRGRTLARSARAGYAEAGATERVGSIDRWLGR